MKFIVTAGGQGTKVWPFSRKDKPKQFQKIVGDESLFTYNVKLLLQKYPPEDIYISTKQQYVKLALEQAPEIPIKNYIIEPNIAKNRGPAEGLAFLILYLQHPEEPFMIVQSDDIRLPEDKYLEMIADMEKVVTRDRKHITGGILPEYPVLGVDYFELDDEVNLEGSDNKIYSVKKFLGREADYEKTSKLIKSGRIAMHCNHSCWFPELILEAYKKYRPDWYEALMKIKEVIGKPNESENIEKIYESMESGATEEVTKHIFADSYVIALPYKWIDLGTWDSLYEYVSGEDSTYTEGTVVALDSEGTLVKSAKNDKLVAVVGLEDMVVVDTDDILLIMPRDRAGKIKDIHEEIKSKHLDEYL